MDNVIDCHRATWDKDYAAALDAEQAERDRIAALEAENAELKSDLAEAQERERGLREAGNRLKNVLTNDDSSRAEINKAMDAWNAALAAQGKDK